MFLPYRVNYRRFNYKRLTLRFSFRKTDKKKIKTYNNFFLTNSNKIVFNLDLDLQDTKYENESITFKIKNLNKSKIEEIKFVSLNKYNIKDYEIIDNYDRCYLIK